MNPVNRTFPRLGPSSCLSSGESSVVHALQAAAIVSLMKAESSGVAMEKVETDRSAEVLAEVESAQAGAVLHIMDAVRAGQILSKIPIEHASAVVVFMGADEAAAAVQKLDKLNGESPPRQSRLIRAWLGMRCCWGAEGGATLHRSMGSVLLRAKEVPFRVQGSARMR